MGFWPKFRFLGPFIINILRANFFNSKSLLDLSLNEKVLRSLFIKHYRANFWHGGHMSNRD